MRILLLSTYFNPDIASTGVLMSQLAHELTQLGNQVTVITSMPHYDTNRIWKEYRGKLLQQEKNGSLTISRVYVYVPGEKGHFTKRILNYATFNLLSGLTGLFLGRHDVILVSSPPLTNGISADFISRLCGTPFVYNVQDIWPDVVVRAGVLTNPRAIAFFRRLEAYVYRRAHTLTVLSEDFRKNLENKGVPSEKIKVIPNFCDTDFVRPLQKENPFSKREGLTDKFVVLFAGNMGHSQGLETVLEAARLLEEAPVIQFLIVGNGVAKGALKEYAKELGLKNTRFLTFQSHETVPNMYATADVGLVPLRRGFTNESVPSKIYSIMSAGRPTIASVDIGSDTWNLVRKAQCGFGTEPENPQAMADAIRALYRNRHVGTTMGKNGREHVLKYCTYQKAAQQYHELFSSIVNTQLSDKLASNRA